MCVCLCVCVGDNMPVSYHDGSDDNRAVLHARSVIWKQRRVLDQHQFVCVIPITDLQRKLSMRLCIGECVHVYALMYSKMQCVQLALQF